MWSVPEFGRLVGKGEDWLRSEGVVTAVARVRQDFTREIDELGRSGYREVRRLRFSELDLIAKRDLLLAVAAQQRPKTQAQTVAMLTLSDDGDPDRLGRRHEDVV